MEVDFKDFRMIILMVDANKDVVIFPISKTMYPIEMPDGSKEFEYLVAYYPIELKYPYDTNELAQKIEYGIEQWCKHECYDNFSGRNTFEEKYYGVKGFKNAVKGKLYIILGWDEIAGKFVSLQVPMKRGYAYLGLDHTRLPDDADWIDFAETIIKYIEMDITKLEDFTANKNELNW